MGFLFTVYRIGGLFWTYDLSLYPLLLDLFVTGRLDVQWVSKRRNTRREMEVKDTFESSSMIIDVGPRSSLFNVLLPGAPGRRNRTADTSLAASCCGDVRLTFHACWTGQPTFSYRLAWLHQGDHSRGCIATLSFLLLSSPY